jgi:hypothetical protein
MVSFLVSLRSSSDGQKQQDERPWARGPAERVRSESGAHGWCGMAGSAHGAGAGGVGRLWGVFGWGGWGGWGVGGGGGGCLGGRVAARAYEMYSAQRISQERNKRLGARRAQKKQKQDPEPLY